VTGSQALTDVGPVPDHETLIEIPEEVLKFLRAPLRAGEAT
jgi:hypothetical protein